LIARFKTRGLQYSNWLERLHVLLNPKLSNKFHKQT